MHENNKVVVTGGSRGLGAGIAYTLMRAGFNVIVIARNVVDGIRECPNMEFIKWDLAAIESLPELARKIHDEFGSIYGLVNNAGIGTAGILSTQPTAAIEQVFRLNVLSPIVLTKHLVKPMLSAQSGRIINISSIVAATGYSGLSVYSASKAAMIGFTKSLAREVGSLGITVNAVAPGFLDTDMTHGLSDKQRAQIAHRSALQRMATIDDVGAAVRFLMSEGAKNITGTVMTIDAGNTA